MAEPRGMSLDRNVSLVPLLVASILAGPIGFSVAAEEDAVAPAISITSPVEGAILTSTFVTVTGTASDDVSVERVEVRRDGMDWLSATGTSSWSANLTLSEGQNTIRARATDTSGNQAMATVSVTVELLSDGGAQPTDLLPGGLLTFVGVALALVGLGLLALVVLRGRNPRSPP